MSEVEKVTMPMLRLSLAKAEQVVNATRAVLASLRRCIISLAPCGPYRHRRVPTNITPLAARQLRQAPKVGWSNLSALAHRGAEMTLLTTSRSRSNELFG